MAERNISIFRRIDELVDEQIVVGGPRLEAIPEDEFPRLLRDFPTSTELKHYTRKRISRVLREYLDTMTDSETGWRPTWNVERVPDLRGRRRPTVGYRSRASWNWKSSPTFVTVGGDAEGR